MLVLSYVDGGGGDDCVVTFDIGSESFDGSPSALARCPAMPIVPRDASYNGSPVSVPGLKMRRANGSQSICRDARLRKENPG
jgi:hypothetical protein